MLFGGVWGSESDRGGPGREEARRRCAGVGQPPWPSRPQEADLSNARKLQGTKDTSSRHKAPSPRRLAGVRAAPGVLTLGASSPGGPQRCRAPPLPRPSTTSVLDTEGQARAPGPHCPALEAPQGGPQAQSLALCSQVALMDCWTEGTDPWGLVYLARGVAVAAWAARRCEREASAGMRGPRVWPGPHLSRRGPWRPPRLDRPGAQHCGPAPTLCVRSCEQDTL